MVSRCQHWIYQSDPRWKPEFQLNFFIDSQVNEFDPCMITKTRLLFLFYLRFHFLSMRYQIFYSLA